MDNNSSDETLVGMYKLKKIMNFFFVVVSWSHTKGSVIVLGRYGNMKIF
jgi:hypothetical protein